MEAFEKWAGPGFYYGQDPLDRPGLEHRKQGWRAALEWARTQATDIQSTELDDAIRKELEN